MKKTAAALAAAVLLSGCAGGDLRKLDRVLDEAESSLQARACVPPAPDKVVALARKSPELLTAARWDLERYYTCLSFAKRDVDICAGLAPLRLTVEREEGVPPIGLDLLCKTVYYEALMAEDVITGGGKIKELCVMRNLVGDRDFALGSLNISCGIIAAHQADVEDTCTRLTPYFDNASIAKTCRKMLRYVSGDETVCPLFEDHMVNERCRSYVALKKKRCEGTVFCSQVLEAAGERACEPAKKAMGETVCRLQEAARPKTSPLPLFVRASKLIDESEGRESAAKLDERAERLARLRLRWEEGGK